NYTPGAQNIYTITVTNDGLVAATGVHVINAIPAGITGFSWVGSNGSSGTNADLDDTIATLAPGATVTYTVTLDVPAGFTAPLVSEVTYTTTSPEGDTSCTDCTDT